MYYKYKLKQNELTMTQSHRIYICITTLLVKNKILTYVMY